MRKKEEVLSIAAQEGFAPVPGPALGCPWGEKEKLGFPLPLGGTPLGRSALLKVFCLESPGKINPFVNRTLPVFPSCPNRIQPLRS